MQEIPNNTYPIEKRLVTEDTQQIREQNTAELDRPSTIHIFTVEKTEEWPESMVISYGNTSTRLSLRVRDLIEPGRRIVVIQQSEDPVSPIEEVYMLGENLKERKE